MRAILGIGNCGFRYQYSRHNAGFLILDYVSNILSVEFKASKDDYYFCEGKLNQMPFYLIKPCDFVNNSGIGAKQFLQDVQVDLSDFLVVCDDVNLPIGKIAVRRNGGDGGHNGVASIIYHLNSNLFPRLKIGIGNDFPAGQLSAYVLDDFSKEEEKVLPVVLKKSSILIREFILGGIDSMLDANSKMVHNDEESSIN